MNELLANIFNIKKLEKVTAFGNAKKVAIKKLEKVTAFGNAKKVAAYNKKCRYRVD